MASGTKIKTRILIISDTHGARPYPRLDPEQDTDDELREASVNNKVHRIPTAFRDPLPEADVVLHCGDLTKRSTPPEYRETFAMLREIRAPLKIVIAGNHDMALDKPFWSEHQTYLRLPNDPDLNFPTEALQIIQEAKADGVRYIEEGLHTFDLNNGARLRIYASQWTPEYGGWGFQYGEDGHSFDIPSDVDVAMTHGPPRGVLDYAGRDGVRAGCNWLFEAVHKAKPKIHCFGHIHEAWGAYLARWKEGEGITGRVKETVDEENSRFIKKLKNLRPSYVDNEKARDEKLQALKQICKDRGVLVDLTEGENKIEVGKQTLFVNAAIMDMGYRPTQCPWIIDVDLRSAHGSSMLAYK